MDIISTIDIDAPVHAAWQLLGEEFGEVSDWADPVTASSLDGPLDQGVTRICNIKAVGPFAAGEITETLSEFNRQQKILTYVVDSGGPPFVNHLQNRWILEPLDETSSVAKSTITYRLKWWAVPFAPLFAVMMKKAVAPIFAQFQEAVRARHQADPGSGRQAWSQMA